MEPGTDYAAAWRDYGRRGGTFMVVGGGGVAALITFRLVAIDGPLTRHATANGTFQFLCFVWLAATIVTGLRFAAFRCPRCGHVFVEFPKMRGRPGWYHRRGRWPARRCSHCSLGVGEDRTDDPRAAS
jgi:hypothetical protein